MPEPQESQTPSLQDMVVAGQAGKVIRPKDFAAAIRAVHPPDTAMTDGDVIRSFASTNPKIGMDGWKYDLSEQAASATPVGQTTQPQPKTQSASQPTPSGGAKPLAPSDDIWNAIQRGTFTGIGAMADFANAVTTLPQRALNAVLPESWAKAIAVDPHSTASAPLNRFAYWEHQGAASRPAPTGIGATLAAAVPEALGQVAPYLLAPELKLAEVPAAVRAAYPVLSAAYRAIPAAAKMGFMEALRASPQGLLEALKAGGIGALMGGVGFPAAEATVGRFIPKAVPEAVRRFASVALPVGAIDAGQGQSAEDAAAHGIAYGLLAAPGAGGVKPTDAPPPVPGSLAERLAEVRRKGDGGAAAPAAPPDVPPPGAGTPPAAPPAKALSPRAQDAFDRIALETMRNPNFRATPTSIAKDLGIDKIQGARIYSELRHPLTEKLDANGALLGAAGAPAVAPSIPKVAAPPPAVVAAPAPPVEVPGADMSTFDQAPPAAAPPATSSNPARSAQIESRIADLQRLMATTAAPGTPPAAPMVSRPKAGVSPDSALKPVDSPAAPAAPPPVVASPEPAGAAIPVAAPPPIAPSYREAVAAKAGQTVAEMDARTAAAAPPANIHPVDTAPPVAPIAASPEATQALRDAGVLPPAAGIDADMALLKSFGASFLKGEEGTQYYDWRRPTDPGRPLPDELMRAAKNVGRHYFDQGMKSFESWKNEMVSKIGPWVEGHLMPLWLQITHPTDAPTVGAAGPGAGLAPPESAPPQGTVLPPSPPNFTWVPGPDGKLMAVPAPGEAPKWDAGARPVTVPARGPAVAYDKLGEPLARTPGEAASLVAAQGGEPSFPPNRVPLATTPAPPPVPTDPWVREQLQIGKGGAGYFPGADPNTIAARAIPAIAAPRVELPDSEIATRVAQAQGATMERTSADAAAIAEQDRILRSRPVTTAPPPAPPPEPIQHITGTTAPDQEVYPLERALEKAGFQQRDPNPYRFQGVERPHVGGSAGKSTPTSPGTPREDIMRDLPSGNVPNAVWTKPVADGMIEMQWDQDTHEFEATKHYNDTGEARSVHGTGANAMIDYLNRVQQQERPVPSSQATSQAYGGGTPTISFRPATSAPTPPGPSTAETAARQLERTAKAVPTTQELERVVANIKARAGQPGKGGAISATEKALVALQKENAKLKGGAAIPAATTPPKLPDTGYLPGSVSRQLDEQLLQAIRTADTGPAVREGAKGPNVFSAGRALHVPEDTHLAQPEKNAAAFSTLADYSKLTPDQLQKRIIDAAVKANPEGGAASTKPVAPSAPGRKFTKLPEKSPFTIEPVGKDDYHVVSKMGRDSGLTPEQEAAIRDMSAFGAEDTGMLDFGGADIPKAAPPPGASAADQAKVGAVVNTGIHISKTGPTSYEVRLGSGGEVIATTTSARAAQMEAIKLADQKLYESATRGEAFHVEGVGTYSPLGVVKQPVPMPNKAGKIVNRQVKYMKYRFAPADGGAPVEHAMPLMRLTVKDKPFPGWDHIQHIGTPTDPTPAPSGAQAIPATAPPPAPPLTREQTANAIAENARKMADLERRLAEMQAGAPAAGQIPATGAPPAPMEGENRLPFRLK